MSTRVDEKINVLHTSYIRVHGACDNVLVIIIVALYPTGFLIGRRRRRRVVFTHARTQAQCHTHAHTHTHWPANGFHFRTSVTWAQKDIFFKG